MVTTIQGSFSSVPRYVLVFFPSFLSFALFFESKPIFLKTTFIIILMLLLIIEAGLFLRGYWIA